MPIQEVDESFLETFQIELVAGRDFRRDLESEPEQPFLLNEEAVAQLGWKDPIGKAIVLGSGDGWRGLVIGVVKDYHYGPLREQIGPQIITTNIYLS